MQPDTSNTVFQQAVAFITQTNRSLFLTGKAGTGKTTFLKYIKENCFKKLAVVAPTGVAAINAGGVTVHSFFQIPFGMYIPVYSAAWGEDVSPVFNKNQLLSKMKLSSTKRDLMRELDLLIVDEVSMLRADMLDAVDTVLRSVRRRYNEPFGGVQMLFIGDLFQLPPVVTQAEWPIFHERYKTPFFFEASAFQEAPPVYLELKKIYRQSDPDFIRLLNHIRNNCCTADDLERLGQYHRPGYRPSAGEGYITLTSHNYKAEAINREHLARLSARTCTFEADIQGEFPDSSHPASRKLFLKEGAQIMFVKNDKGEERRYFNGKIGIVQHMEKKHDKILVSFPGEEGVLELQKETWRNIRYKYNAEKDEITEEELGTFMQYPVRLAWAITIHKSQGLTFEKAIIDAGASFAAGQVYVALSRLTTLDGLVLHSVITPRNILTDERVLTFSAHELPEDVIQQSLGEAREVFLHQTLREAFDWSKLLEKTDLFIHDAAHSRLAGKPHEVARLNTIKGNLLKQYEVAEKFKRQLEKLSALPDKTELHERTAKASAWFSAVLEAECIIPLQDHFKEIKIKTKAKKLIKGLQELVICYIRKQQQIGQAVEMAGLMGKTGGLAEFTNYLETRKRPQEITLPAAMLPASKPAKGETYRISLELFQKGIGIEEIAIMRKLTRGTIENHLLKFIPTGEVDVHDLVGPEKLKSIMEILEGPVRATSFEIRDQLNKEVSYTQVKAAMLYRQWRDNGKKKDGI